MALKTIPCPQCGGSASAAAANEWRPFCCKRCKMIDLGDWLDESNRIPGPPAGMPGADDWDTDGNTPSGSSH